MEKKRVWIVDDGDVILADDKVDAYYQALKIMANDDPDVLVMLISDFLTVDDFVELGEYINTHISHPLVKEYEEVQGTNVPFFFNLNCQNIQKICRAPNSEYSENSNILKIKKSFGKRVDTCR